MKTKPEWKSKSEVTFNLDLKILTWYCGRHMLRVMQRGVRKYILPVISWDFRKLNCLRQSILKVLDNASRVSRTLWTKLLWVFCFREALDMTSCLHHLEQLHRFYMLLWKMKMTPNTQKLYSILNAQKTHANDDFFHSLYWSASWLCCSH